MENTMSEPRRQTHDVKYDLLRSRRIVQMSHKAWLKGREMDVLKKIFVATGILVSDFELLTGRSL